MKTLLLIDIQNDFLPGGSLAVPEGDEIIPVTNQLQSKFDLIVATQDWHPEDHKSFASNHPGKAVYQQVELHGMPQVLWPNHCVQCMEGAEFSKKLNMSKVAAIFRKGMDPEIDSYSGFYDNGHKVATGLSSYLKEKGAKQIYLAGLAGDFCVYFSALDAVKEGFEVFFIEDATRFIDEEGWRDKRLNLIQSGVQLIKSSRII